MLHYANKVWVMPQFISEGKGGLQGQKFEGGVYYSVMISDIFS